MDDVKYFKDLFETIPEYRKIVLILFSIKSDDHFLIECGLLNSDINRLYL